MRDSNSDSNSDSNTKDVEPDGTSASAKSAKSTKYNTPPPTPILDILLEQFDFILTHHAQMGKAHYAAFLGAEVKCLECERYVAVKVLLLERFETIVIARSVG